MTESRSIVCGVDDSEFSDHALVAAFGLARERNLEVRLVHASGLSGLLDRLTGEDLDQARSKTVARLEAMLTAAGFESPEVASRLEIVDGPAARAVVQAARDHDAALIVLGRHQGLTALGDTVRAVVAHAPCPVLVQPVSAGPVRRILAAVDLSPESRRVLSAAHDEALAPGREGPSVTVLHCFVRPELGYIFGYPVPMPASLIESSRETARSDFDKEVGAIEWGSIEPAKEFVEADPATEILARAADTDLIVLGTHGRTGLSFSVLGGVAGRVLHEVEVPVLVVRAPDRAWAL